jgi:hypothetical protein
VARHALRGVWFHFACLNGLEFPRRAEMPRSLVNIQVNLKRFRVPFAPAHRTRCTARSARPEKHLSALGKVEVESRWREPALVRRRAVAA